MNIFYSEIWCNQLMKIVKWIRLPHTEIKYKDELIIQKETTYQFIKQSISSTK